ncbi:aminotransferase class I/II-fold pyridoxal phosphate-dependent enzyme [Pontibacter sp. G13]|uniref:trans-sulfuration enzyme family protein n=1 Tax=Pontibacter sp. G13 TaxID=3074898 RepID=UPI00288B7C31|nr:aminotransferase class I/II-fold pyridoxal phosphate-dependent enzyme [Pontibacter sp. G13]WNJ19187.1 aminotransferase class I/II-fold pyridoxal phosphate-dependent enzyme [Pontibacter sp. G13]
MSNNPKFETQAIRTQSERTGNREHTAPLYLTSSFLFDDAEQMRAMFADEIPGNLYSRFSNPNTTELIDKVCLLEGAESGYATATGMAAVFTTLAALCSSGDHILACRSVFGSTHTVLTKLLPKWNITHSYVDIHETDSWAASIQPNTKLLFVETPSNPAVDILDLEWLGKFADEHGLILIVDNCFATPYLQQPIKFGAHLVLHSATKYMDGQGRVLGGLVVGKEELVDEVRLFARHSGPALSPFNAWILSKSIETLALRMDRHCSNALALAERLESHPDVELVKYPFLPSHPQYEVAKKQMRQGGGIVSIVVNGGVDRGREFLNQVKVASLTANLGDSRTIVTHPASTTHAKLTDDQRAEVGILPGLIRISVGLEHVDDIIADIEQALAASKPILA